MARLTPDAVHPPARRRRFARRRGHALASGAAVALLALGAQAALAADAAVTVDDTVGDVTVDPSGPVWYAPDILRAGLGYEGGADADPGDDVVRGVMSVDASKDPGVQARVYSGRIVSWWIDTDNNPATGATRSDLGRGADALVVVFGTASGLPSKALVKFAQNGQFPRDGREIPVSIGAGGVEWTQTPAQLGVQRGRPVRVWFETAYTDGSGRTLASDVAPDDKSARVLVPPFPPPAATAGVSVTGPASVGVGGTIDGRGAPSRWYVVWWPPGGTPVATAEVGDDGTAPHAFQVPIDGLSPSVQYQYQVVVANPWGETRTPPAPFSLPAPAPAAPVPLPAAGVTSTPVVQTTPPGRASGQTLTLTGMFAPSGAVNGWFFEWGASPALGRSTVVRSAARGGPLPVRVTLSRLNPGTTYHYRLVGIVDGVRTEGPVQTAATARVGKLALAGRVRMVCRAGVCAIGRRTTLTVRVSDAAGRAVTGRRALRGLRAGVRCLKACRGHRRVTARVSRGRVALVLPPVVQSWRLRRGAVVELRVTRPGGTGVAYRVHTLGARARGTVCRVDLTGVPRCPVVRRGR